MLVTVRDTSLYVERSGTGPALLFIHGMCGDADSWRGQVARLADRFTCVAYDRRGHSRSSLGTEPEGVPTDVADAAALITALDLPRPVVVASSGGARVAVALARTHPDLPAGVVASEPPIGSLDRAAFDPFLSQVAATVRPALGADGPGAAVDAFFSLVCPGLWAQVDEAGRDRYRANASRMLAEFAGPPFELTVEDLADVSVRFLVLSGTLSHPGLRSVARALASALPQARLLDIEGSGHVPYVEQPEAFARAVADFADEVSAAHAVPLPTGS